MENISWLDKVTNEEVLRKVNTETQILNSGKGSVDELAMFWDVMPFCMKLLKAEWEENQQEGEEEFKCYMIWQIMVAMLHWNGQLRTEKDSDTEKGCQKPAVQQKTTDDSGLGWSILSTKCHSNNFNEICRVDDWTRVYVIVVVQTWTCSHKTSVPWHRLTATIVLH